MSRNDRNVPDICPVQSTVGKVVTWPMPLTEKPFPLYKLTVDGIEVPVWSGRVREDIHRPADAGFTHMYNGATEWCGFARFDFAGSVEVAVTVDREFNSAEIVPRSAGIACAVDGRTVHFRMDEQRPLTLLLDGRDREPLHLFTHRPETDVPSPDDPNVIYFGPGEHWVDTIQVRSGQTVYLDGGALVRAVLPPGAQGKRSGGVLKLVGYPGGPVLDVSEAENVQIRGRGILDGTPLPHPVRNLIRLHRSRKVRVEGITLRNSPNWHLPIVDCDEVEVDGLCGLSGRLNSDGINCVSSRDVTVRNCFMRTHDDTYAVKTTVPGRPSEHIRYERCVAWNDWGFALGVTYETRADIRDVAFTDCDVIFARNWPIGIHATDGGTVEYIRFERIGVDYPQTSIAPHMGRALARIDNQKDCWSTEPGIARVRGILLRDIDVRGQAVDHIDIQGNDAEHPVTDVRFENVRVNGEPLDAGQVAANEHVHDWVVRLNEHVADLRLAKNGNMRENVLAYLKAQGKGAYLFGQVATWVHNENPDMDHPSNWLKKVQEHTGQLPGYGCMTYDFNSNPFSDAAWNEGVRKLWDRGLIVGVYSFFANPSGGRWNEPVDFENIWAPGENAIKTNFFRQLDRMAANLQWLKDRGIPVVYTPFVESDDAYKWHAKKGSEAVIRLYRLVHDYFQATKKLDNIIWAYHTTQNSGALEQCYPGDAYVDVIGKSAYGQGLPFDEYEWAVAKKRDHGKVIWWAELGIRDAADAPRDCFDVLKKLEQSFPELAGFVFWSDEGHYNVVGNLNGRAFMAHPQISTLEQSNGERV